MRPTFELVDSWDVPVQKDWAPGQDGVYLRESAEQAADIITRSLGSDLFIGVVVPKPMYVQGVKATELTIDLQEVHGDKRTITSRAGCYAPLTKQSPQTTVIVKAPSL